MRITYEEEINRCAFKVRILTTCLQTAKENEDKMGIYLMLGFPKTEQADRVNIKKKGKNKTDYTNSVV